MVIVLIIRFTTAHGVFLAEQERNYIPTNCSLLDTYIYANLPVQTNTLQEYQKSNKDCYSDHVSPVTSCYEIVFVLL